MKQLLDDVYQWRVWRPGSFRGVSFNGCYLRVGDERLVVDPPPLTSWDLEHLHELGPPTRILITNANHLRAAAELRERWGAPIHVPAADREAIACEVQGTFADGDVVGGLRVVGLADQKTPGESALYWEERKLLILGDALIGAPRGALCLLPDAKFADVAQARAGLERLAELEVDAVIPGDGDPVLVGGASAIRAALGGIPEAPLEESEQGTLRSAGPGWFVLNLARCGWFVHPSFGACGILQGEPAFEQFGLNVSVLQPDQPGCLYHAETEQEGFLVLHGRAKILIEEQERTLDTWDYVHCPRGTKHVLVGGGDGPCAILRLGSRQPGAGLLYPVSELAARYGASSEATTENPRQAYAPHGRSQPGPCPWPLG